MEKGGEGRRKKLQHHKLKEKVTTTTWKPKDKPNTQTPNS